MTNHPSYGAASVNILYSLMGRTIVIHDALLDLCYGAKSAYETAAFLERIIYFQGKKIEQGEDPWVYDSREVLCATLRMSERQLKNAIEFLVSELEVLATERRMIIYQGKPATVTHYLIDIQRVMTLLQQLKSPVLEPSDGEVRKTIVGDPSATASDGRRTPSSDADSRKASDAYKETKN